MQGYLRKLPDKIRKLIYLARRVSSQGNVAAYLVGGFVRDLLLRVRNLDLDITVDGDGIKFAEELASLLKARIIRHKQFGTATIFGTSGLKIDVATSRKEYYTHPGALPKVARGSIKEDLFRRDFSINAMAISINPAAFGKLTDSFGGQEDLRLGKIRVLHILSFIDDPTRILRAIRFEQRYGFQIETKTLKLLKDAVKHKMLEKVEPQRLRDELILMLSEESSLKMIKRYQQLAGLSFISPRLRLNTNSYNFIRSIEKEISHYKRVYPKRRALDIWLIRFMGLIDSLSLKDTERVCDRFVFRRGEAKRILSAKQAGFDVVSELSREGILPSRIFHLLEPLSYEVIILMKAKYSNRTMRKNIEDFFDIYNGIRISVSGEDLHKLGVSPGPYYQQIFSQVLKAKLEGLVRSKQEELALIRKLVKA